MLKVSQFMNKALFDKDSGYYRKKNPIGKEADFITAPEISQAFGELLAAYILQVSANIKTPISLVEMGAGKGTLFYDILLTIDKLARKNNPQAVDFLSKTTFHIIEINEVLRKFQQEKLKNFTVKWYENFTEFLNINSEKIFFISNELFDCFPIDQFVKTDIGWCERLVIKKVQDFEFISAKFDPKTHNFVENLIGFKDSQKVPFGGVFEYSEVAKNFMSQLCQALESRGGIAINFDYGYVKTEFANTLQAIKNHQKTSVLENVGEADITALVDFSLLEKIVKSYRLDSSLISQREFLMALGIEERRKILLQEKSDEEKNLINLSIDRLIAPEAMGELFKCLIVWK